MAIHRITEKKIIKVWQDCINTPVQLRWITSEGGELYWVFGFNQTEGLESLAIGIINRNIIDLETATEDRAYTQKTANPQMILGAENLDDDDIQILKTLIYSTSVQMKTESNQWQTILVVPGTFSVLETNHERHRLELTISLPQLNTQIQ